MQQGEAGRVPPAPRAARLRGIIHVRFSRSLSPTQGGRPGQAGGGRARAPLVSTVRRRSNVQLCTAATTRASCDTTRSAASRRSSGSTPQKRGWLVHVIRCRDRPCTVRRVTLCVMSKRFELSGSSRPTSVRLARSQTRHTDLGPPGRSKETQKPRRAGRSKTGWPEKKKRGDGNAGGEREAGRGCGVRRSSRPSSHGAGTAVRAKAKEGRDRTGYPG